MRFGQIRSRKRPGQIRIFWPNAVLAKCGLAKCGHDRANIRVHHGKTKVWNRAGAEPRGCEELTVAARMVKESATVWVGDQALPSIAQGMRVLGSPIGHRDSVRSFLEKKNDRAFRSFGAHSIALPPEPTSCFAFPPKLVRALAKAHDVGM